MLNDEQKELLTQPLNKADVSTRKQGGSMVAYVEGWHVQAEANRIFGFDGWSMHTMYCKEVCRYAVEIGEKKIKGHKVGYEAHVRITVGDVTRDGIGSCCGSAKDLFDAIELAGKGAETDAMKRALKSFGNIFGLCLYNDGKLDVDNTPPAPPKCPTGDALNDLLSVCDDEAAVKALYSRLTEAIKALSEKERLVVVDAFKARKQQVNSPPPVAEIQDTKEATEEYLGNEINH
jgi:DNA recombination protein Rad52